MTLAGLTSGSDARLGADAVLSRIYLRRLKALALLPGLPSVHHLRHRPQKAADVHYKGQLILLRSSGALILFFFLFDPQILPSCGIT